MSTPQVFLITGCSSGFGHALVKHFLAAGQNVVATARDVTKVEHFVKQYPRTALALRLDVTDKSSIHEAVQKTIAKFGRLDVLINNAGYGLMAPAEFITERELRAIMETNFFGAVFTSQAVLPQMRKQRSGAIIQVSSSMGATTLPANSAYCATKFALAGFSEALATEVAPLGIRVVITEPGGFNTGVMNKIKVPSPETVEPYEAVKQLLPLLDLLNGGQTGDPAKFAVAIEQILALEKPPLRIPIGNDSLTMVRAHAVKQIEEIDAFKHIGSKTDYDQLNEAQLNLLKMFGVDQSK